MASQSAIEWTQATRNPVTGCTKAPPGCKHCYAERMALRLMAMGQRNYANGFSPTLQPHMLDKPLQWRTPQLIFVNSMSDLFHADVPEAYIRKVFNIMERAHWHVFQVLTKRAGRLAELSNRLVWPPNVWMGVSVETMRYVHRIAKLLETPATVRFLSIEPLLGPLPELPLDGVDWVIVGGESGPGARPMKKEWVDDIKSQCVAQRVPFFFKQWGGSIKKKTGRLLDGRTWDQMPALAQEDRVASIAP